jgi:hypothetical protein
MKIMLKDQFVFDLGQKGEFFCIDNGDHWFEDQWRLCYFED